MVLIVVGLKGGDLGIFIKLPRNCQEIADKLLTNMR